MRATQVTALATARRVTGGGLTVNPPKVSISPSALVPHYFYLHFFPLYSSSDLSPLVVLVPVAPLGGCKWLVWELSAKTLMVTFE